MRRVLPPVTALLALAACVAEPVPSLTTGELRIHVAVVGAPGDPDGVRISVDGGEVRRVGPGGETLFEELEPGEHEVEVSDVAGGCSAERGRRRPVAVLAGVTTPVTVTVLCGDEQAIAYWSTLRAVGGTELYTIRPDGTSPVRLTFSDGVAELSPAWSPDRTRVVYGRQGEGGSVSFWVRELDGSEERLLVSATAAGSISDPEPAWAPDGSRIAFVSSGAVWLVRPDGTGLELLREDASGPAWSPDGARIAFVRQFGESSDLMVMDADGTGLRRLTDTPLANEAGPTWSPDGRRIAFVRRAPELGEIRTVDPDGGDERLVRRVPVVGGELAWSPAGGWIAGIMGLESGTGLALVRPDGGTVQLVLTGDFTLGDPAW